MDAAHPHEPLWDAKFRARMLRHGLSNEEIAQAVEVAEAAAVERDRLATENQQLRDAIESWSIGASYEEAFRNV